MQTCLRRLLTVCGISIWLGSVCSALSATLGDTLDRILSLFRACWATLSCSSSFWYGLFSDSSKHSLLYEPRIRQATMTFQKSRLCCFEVTWCKDQAFVQALVDVLVRWMAPLIFESFPGLLTLKKPMFSTTSLVNHCSMPTSSWYPSSSNRSWHLSFPTHSVGSLQMQR